MLRQFTSKSKVPFLSFVWFLGLFATIFRVFFPNGITFHKVKKKKHSTNLIHVNYSYLVQSLKERKKKKNHNPENDWCPHLHHLSSLSACCLSVWEIFVIVRLRPLDWVGRFCFTRQGMPISDVVAKLPQVSSYTIKVFVDGSWSSFTGKRSHHFV